MVDEDGFFIEEEQKTGNGIPIVSHSQWAMWKKCPKSWALRYKDKIKIQQDPSPYGFFGTALHEAIQTFVTDCYKFSMKKAMETKHHVQFQNRLIELYKEEKARVADAQPFLTKEEFKEFMAQGIEMVTIFKKKRSDFFSTKTHELIGIEVKIEEDLETCKLVGYLDIVFRHKRTGKYKIIDLKSSTRGWSDWQKKDFVKVAQLLLYKWKYAEALGVDPKQIEVIYVIIKRIIPDPETTAYPVKRIQKFKPVDGTVTMKKVRVQFEKFIEAAYGSNVPSEYKAYADIDGSNCRFCPYQNLFEHCLPGDRINKKHIV